jgi:pimeloyl-ACP methyl ester carboxylesterase
MSDFSGSDSSAPTIRRGGRFRRSAIGTVLVLAVAGCGGGPGAAPSSSATGNPAAASPSASATTGVTAVVNGRKLAGVCTGVASSRPTVLLEVGMGAPRQALSVVEEHLGPRTRVCSYDRAGKGESDPPTRTPRPVAEVVSDAHTFLTEAARQGAGPPYFLVGQSFGGEVVILYAQAHSGEVAGFVAINPSPPYKTWLKRARTVETEAEMQEFELPFPRGDNDEGVNTSTDESMLTDPLPADLPYALMFDEVCSGLPFPLQNPVDCKHLIGQLELTAKDLAHVGKGGSYVRVEGAGHDIQDSRPDAVRATIDRIWTRAAGR